MPPTVQPGVGDGSDSASDPDPGVSDAASFAPAYAAAAAAFSLANLQSITNCSHHGCGTRAPRRLSATSQSPIIGRVAINCATVFYLRRTDVLVLTTLASFRAPAREG